MNTLKFLAPASLLALCACGETNDASQDATADTVEFASDEAMAGIPDPVADAEALSDGSPADEQAIEGAIEAAETEAEAAANAAQRSTAAASPADAAAAAAPAAQ